MYSGTIASYRYGRTISGHYPYVATHQPIWTAPSGLAGTRRWLPQCRVKGWRLHLWSGKSLADLAQEINPIVRGWIDYYGYFYKSRLISLLRRINEYLARWATRKYKRLRGHPHRARRFVATVSRREPGLFAHWQAGAQPSAG